MVAIEGLKNTIQLLVNLTMVFSMHEKVIDPGFWKAPCTIILPRFGLVMSS